MRKVLQDGTIVTVTGTDLDEVLPGETVTRIRIHSAHPSWGAAGVRDFTFEGSNDNANWNILLSDTAANDLNNFQTFDFVNTVAYRYYRLNIASSYFGNIGVRELELWENPTTQ